MKVIILAGGLGTRLSEYTQDIPKPMVCIGEYPVVWHIIRIYGHFGHTNVTLALGYKAEYVKGYFLHYYDLQTDFSIDMKTGEHTSLSHSPIDFKINLIDTGLHTMTGGRLRRLRDHVKDETFLVTYGDGVANVDINKVIEFHKQHGKLVTMTVTRPPARYGIVRMDANGQVQDFREKPKTDAYINGGFFVMEPGFLDYIDGDEEPLEQGPLDRALSDNQLMAYRHNGFWHPMDTKRDVTDLNKMWESGKAPWKLWKD
jgi:glucose-1-phosphate cytidylyltransferase